MFFFCPTASHFTLQLSSCGIFLVPSGFKIAFTILDGSILADGLNCGLESSIGILSGNTTGAQLARACKM